MKFFKKAKKLIEQTNWLIYKRTDDWFVDVDFLPWKVWISLGYQIQLVTYPTNSILAKLNNPLQNLNSTLTNPNSQKTQNRKKNRNNLFE